MSLSTGPAFDALRTKFVCGWRDISNEKYCGKSGRYEPGQGAAWTTNGAGPHNMQLFVLAADGTVLHCLPGYWETNDLAYELKFAGALNAIWTSTSLSREEKDRRFRELHLAHIQDHAQDMVTRSEMQGFDKKFEIKRREKSDCFLTADSIQPKHRPNKRKNDDLKTCDQIIHERMAARPFVAYAKFDVEHYVDYGRPKYDKKKPVQQAEAQGR